MKSTSRSIRQHELHSPKASQAPDFRPTPSIHPGHSSSVPSPARTSVQSLAGSRLRRHADYQRAYTASRKRQSSSMSWFLAPQSAAYSGAPLPTGPRVGLTVGKVIGKAHERNRIKRRMREVLRRHLDLFPIGFDLILHPRRVVLAIDFAKLEAEIVRILHQAAADAHQIRAHAASLPRPVPAL